jgi:hypothetical protein
VAKIIGFYHTVSGREIDFVIETRKRQGRSKAHIVCLEVKLAETWDRRWERPMRSLSDFPAVIIVDASQFSGGDKPPVQTPTFSVKLCL